MSLIDLRRVHCRDVADARSRLSPRSPRHLLVLAARAKYAGKLTISNKELWEGNNLNRVEVQHKPDNAYLTEGKEIYYGFSFYLPEKLADSDHQILYWETSETYQQVRQVAVKGEHIHFATQNPFKIQWEADGKSPPASGTVS